MGTKLKHIVTLLKIYSQNIPKSKRPHFGQNVPSSESKRRQQRPQNRMMHTQGPTNYGNPW